MSPSSATDTAQNFPMRRALRWHINTDQYDILAYGVNEQKNSHYVRFRYGDPPAEYTWWMRPADGGYDMVITADGTPDNPVVFEQVVDKNVLTNTPRAATKVLNGVNSASVPDELAYHEAESLTAMGLARYSRQVQLVDRFSVAFNSDITVDDGVYSVLALFNKNELEAILDRPLTDTEQALQSDYDTVMDAMKPDWEVDHALERLRGKKQAERNAARENDPTEDGLSP